MHMANLASTIWYLFMTMVACTLALDWNGHGYWANNYGHPWSASWKDWRVSRDHRETAVDLDPKHYGSGWTEKTKNQER